MQLSDLRVVYDVYRSIEKYLPEDDEEYDDYYDEEDEDDDYY